VRHRVPCNNRIVTFTYSGDAPDAVHKVRLLIADTEQADAAGADIYVFEDEELQTLLDLHSGNLFAAAAAAIRAKMAALASAYSISAGQRSAFLTVSASTPLEALTKLAERYEEKAQSADPTELLDWSAEDLRELEDLVPRVYHRSDSEGAGVELD